MARFHLPPLHGAHRHRASSSPEREVLAVLLLRARAEVAALRLVNRDVVDAGLAAGHQAGVAELPQLVAVAAPPLTGRIVALVLEADGDAVVMETPQALAQRIVEFALPFPGQKSHDLVAAHDVLAAIAPLRVDGVGPADTFGISGVPGVLGGLDLLDRRLQRERWQRRTGVGHDLHPAPPVWARPGWLIVTGMDFAMSAKASDYHKRLTKCMTDYVFPAEADYDKNREEAGPHDHTVP